MFPRVLSIPFGYNLVRGVLEEDSHEQEMIGLMQLWREKDNLSYDSIATKLNSLNEPTKRDKIWVGGVINKILQRRGIK